MNARCIRFAFCALALAACNKASSPEPADEVDAAQVSRDASLDAARDGAKMNDASSGGDAGRPAGDAQAAADTDAGQPTASADSYVYIGGWGAGEYPVKTFALSGATGTLSPLSTSTTFGVQPSFIAANADGTRLYLTNEDPSAPGVTVAAVDATGVPSKLDKRSDPGGGGLVHAAISPDGKTLLAADYGKGRLVAFPIDNDGKLGASVSTLSFGGSANTHSSGYHPNGRWAFSPNKGIDVIGQLDVDAATGQLSRRADFETEGDGPRLITISSDGKYAYVMFEDDSSLEAYAIGPDGLLTRIDREQTLPSGFSAKNTGAHALLHPNGKVLYVSNRGANTIVAFTVASDGKLTQLSQTPSGGKTPRCFAIDAAGKWMVVANQDDNNLVTFAVDRDGRLTQTGPAITGVQQPTAVAIVPKR
jgi:6-phosphogluconolactonase